MKLTKSPRADPQVDVLQRVHRAVRGLERQPESPRLDDRRHARPAHPPPGGDQRRRRALAVGQRRRAGADRNPHDLAPAPAPVARVGRPLGLHLGEHRPRQRVALDPLAAGDHDLVQHHLVQHRDPRLRRQPPGDRPRHRAVPLDHLGDALPPERHQHRPDREAARPPRHLRREGLGRPVLAARQVARADAHRPLQRRARRARWRSRSRRAPAATCARPPPSCRPPPAPRSAAPAPAPRSAQSPKAPSTCTQAPFARASGINSANGSNPPLQTLPACRQTTDRPLERLPAPPLAPPAASGPGRRRPPRAPARRRSRAAAASG